MYKSIMVGNHERTKEVIHNAMLKHGLGGSPDSYTLSQRLPDKGKYSGDPKSDHSKSGILRNPDKGKYQSRCSKGSIGQTIGILLNKGTSIFTSNTFGIRAPTVFGVASN